MRILIIRNWYDYLPFFILHNTIFLHFLNFPKTPIPDSHRPPLHGYFIYEAMRKFFLVFSALKIKRKWYIII